MTDLCSVLLLTFTPGRGALLTNYFSQNGPYSRFLAARAITYFSWVEQRAYPTRYENIRQILPAYLMLHSTSAELKTLCLSTKFLGLL